MANNPINIVILAAGRGVRLGFKNNIPKSLVDIEGTPYLKWELEALSQFQPERLILVGGFGLEHLQEFLKKNTFPNTILLNNMQYLKGNLYSVMTAREAIRDGFFIFNADHYYSPENYQKILSVRDAEHITVFCDHDRTLSDDDMKAFANGHQFKKMHKQLTEFQWGYVGVTFIPQLRQDAYWNACLKTEQRLGDHANVEAVINQMAEEGEPVDLFDISGSWWTEIDTPEDLQKTREMIKERMR